VTLASSFSFFFVTDEPVDSAVGICSPSLAYVIHPKPRPHETPGVGGVATSTDDFLPKLFLLRWGAIVETYDAIPSILRETRRLTEAAVMTRGLASSAKHQCLYVADYNDNRIHRIDRTAAGRYVVVNWPVRGRPEGLSVNDAGNLLVACSGTNTVEEFTTYGHLINVVQPSWDIGSLWHAVELPASGGGRAFAVSHGDPGGPHGVSIIDGCGRIVRRYSDGSVGPVKHPRNVVVDRNGFVLVADSGNNRIVAFDPSLGDAKILPLPVPPPGGLQEPWALAYDETRGRLYVGEWSGRRVFAFSNVSDVSVLFRK
jgi:DNA-binding beta-propeller fold protein YncE